MQQPNSSLPTPPITRLPSAADFIPLKNAAKLLPGRPHASAVWRWARKGILARGGTRVRLQHIRVGRVLYTTARWLEEFTAALVKADTAHFDSRHEAATAVRRAVIGSGPLIAESRSAEQRRKDIERAERILNDAGIG